MPSIEFWKIMETRKSQSIKTNSKKNKNRIVGLLKLSTLEFLKSKQRRPTVTLYEIVPEAGIRSTIKNYKMILLFESFRTWNQNHRTNARKRTIGIEVPRKTQQWFRCVPLKLLRNFNQLIWICQWFWKNNFQWSFRSRFKKYLTF